MDGWSNAAVATAISSAAFVTLPAPEKRKARTAVGPPQRGCAKTDTVGEAFDGVAANGPSGFGRQRPTLVQLKTAT